MLEDTLPKVAGDYSLTEVHYDPANWAAGVTSKWGAVGIPAALRLTVFVYPIGRRDEATVVADQIADVERSLHHAVGQGAYADLVLGAREPFAVVAPAPSLFADGEDAERRFDPRPQIELAVEASGPDAEIFTHALASPNSHGQRQSFRFAHDGVPMHSLGYVFYRHLFAIKVRVSVPVDSMDEATFTALADTATLHLVPRVDVQNFGRCGNITLSQAGEGKDASNAMARELMMSIARVRTDNCATSDRVEPSTDSESHRRIEIVYPPGTWKPAE